MDSKKATLAKLLMKEKEFFLPAKYSVFGRSVSLNLSKDQISIFHINKVFLSSQNIDTEDSEEFVCYKISDSQRVSKSAFLIARNEKSEYISYSYSTFTFLNLSKNPILVDNCVTNIFETITLKHKSSIILHNLCLILVLSKINLLNNIKASSETNTNTVNSNLRLTNNRKSITKQAKLEVKTPSVEINIDDFRLRTLNKDSKFSLSTLKKIFEKSQTVVNNLTNEQNKLMTEKNYFENGNGKGAFRNAGKHNGKSLLNTKRRTSPLREKDLEGGELSEKQAQINGIKEIAGNHSDTLLLSSNGYIKTENIIKIE